VIRRTRDPGGRTTSASSSCPTHENDAPSLSSRVRIRARASASDCQIATGPFAKSPTAYNPPITLKGIIRAFRLDQQLAIKGYKHFAYALEEHWPQNREWCEPIRMTHVNWYQKDGAGIAVRHEEHPDNFCGSGAITGYIYKCERRPLARFWHLVTGTIIRAGGRCRASGQR